jgi:putative phosphoribosyl transferase
MNRKEISVSILLAEAELKGIVSIPENALGVVLFAHGSGSSRLSPRNNYVAKSLNSSGLATLLFDLLTPEEEKIDEYTREFRFDIPLLAKRLIQATQWLINYEPVKNLPIAYFGASTGAAAALIAAAQMPQVQAVVSRGGRPDLAGEFLPLVKAATLLIVGGLDVDVIQLNQQAQKFLRCPNQLQIVEGATHLFEEAGTLDQVTQLATQWFKDHLK